MEDGSTVTALFATEFEGKVCTGPTTFDGSAFVTETSDNIRNLTALRGGANRTKALVIDSVSLSTKRFNPPFVHNAKVSGCDIWLVESIRELGDLVDAFLGHMVKIVFPVHALSKDLRTEDIYASSDSCIPLLVCTHGRPIGGGDILGSTEALKSEGFGNVIVMDCDGEVADIVWSELALIPGAGIFSPARQTAYAEQASVRFGMIGDYRII